MSAAISSYSTYLIDLDGVVYRGDELLPGAQAFIAWLAANQKKYLFPTNNSFATEAQVVTKLTRLGIATTTEHVLAAAHAAVQYIANHYPQASVYVVGEPALADLVRAAHLNVVNDTSFTSPDIYKGLPLHEEDNPQGPAQDQAGHFESGGDQASRYSENVSSQTSERNASSPLKADAVLVGLDRTFDYKKLRGAIDAVRAGAAFIAINRDPLLPIEGSFIPGTGTMVAAIEAGSGVKPIVIGKPEPTLLQESMRVLGSQPGETVMIGDNLEVDIQAGRVAGTATLLVLSGKESRARVAQSTLKPDFVFEDLAAVLRAIQAEE